jgi:hypothetical protein
MICCNAASGSGCVQGVEVGYMLDAVLLSCVGVSCTATGISRPQLDQEGYWLDTPELLCRV